MRTLMIVLPYFLSKKFSQNNKTPNKKKHKNDLQSKLKYSKTEKMKLNPYQAMPKSKRKLVQANRIEKCKRNVIAQK